MTVSLPEILSIDIEEEYRDPLDMPARLFVSSADPLPLGVSTFIVIEVVPDMQFPTDYTGLYAYRTAVKSVNGEAKLLDSVLEHKRKSKLAKLVKQYLKTSETSGILQVFRGIEIDDT